MDAEKPIQVYGTDGKYLSNCTKKRAAKMVFRNKAKWIGFNKVELLVTKKEEKIIRSEVLKRDGPICYICNTFLHKNEITHDHVTPRIRGGEDSVKNLAICCRECNEDKGNRTIEEYALLLWLLAFELGGLEEH